MTYMNTFYFILSGQYYSLSYGELDSLMQIYNIVPKSMIDLTQLRIISLYNDVSTSIKSLVKRSGAVREGGKVIAITENYGEESKIVNNLISDHSLINELKTLKDVWIDVHDIRGSARVNTRIVVKKIVDTIGLKLSKRADNIFSIIFTDNIVLFGKVIARLNTKEFNRRKPSSRPFFRSIALPVQLSRILINLTRVKDGDTILDPFCGTGSILIEACYMGLRALGVDINWELVRGARTNLKHYKLYCGESVLSDATVFKSVNIDGIATDPPYGRAASTYGEDIKRIYKGFIEVANDVLDKNKYLVFMAPTWLEDYIDDKVYSSGLILIRKYYIFVHSGLTRVVYEVFKK